MNKTELKSFSITAITFAFVQYFLGTFEWELFVATCVLVFSIYSIYKTLKPNQ